MQDTAEQTVFKPSLAERMKQTDAAYRAIVSAEHLERQEKTRRLKLAREALAESHN